MAAAVRVATFPFRVVWRLCTLLALPVSLMALAWLVFGLASGWFFGIALFCGVWGLVMARLWWVQTTGELRSLARGTVRVGPAGRRGKRGGRR